MSVQISWVFILFLECSIFIPALRPESEADTGSGVVEVAFTPRGHGYANRSIDGKAAKAEAIARLLMRTETLQKQLNAMKADQAGHVKPPSNESERQLQKDIESVKAGIEEERRPSLKQVATPAFTEDELHAALDDHEQPVPDHMMPSALAQKEEHEYEKMVVTTVRGTQGQKLRGILDLMGYAFAMDMNRQAWRKEKKSKFFSVRNETDDNKRKGTWYEAIGQLNFKLLRYPEDEDSQATKGRHRTAKKAGIRRRRKDPYTETEDLQQILMQGFVGTVELRGWWNDATMHFRGEAEKILGDENMLAWLQHAYLPWKRLDMRWDAEGAHCRFDFNYEGKAWWGMGDKQSWGMFRLDAVNPREDTERVFQGLSFMRSVLFSTTMRLDQCVQGSQSESVACPLEMRPISLVKTDGEDDHKLAERFNAPPYATEGYVTKGGPWFTYIGVKGKLNLLWVPNGAGNYQGNPMSSECWGQSPCPSIVHEHFMGQFLKQLVLIHQTDSPTPQTFFLYPIFDDNAMMANPDGTNWQGISSHIKSVPPMAITAASYRSGSNMSSRIMANRQKEDLATEEEMLGEREDEINALQKELEECLHGSPSGAPSGAPSGSPSNAQAVPETQQQGKLNDMQQELDELNDEIQELKKSSK